MKRLLRLFVVLAVVTTACYVPTETGEVDTLRTNLFMPFVLGFITSLLYLGWALGEILKVRPKDIWPGREGSVAAWTLGGTFGVGLLSIVMMSPVMFYVLVGIGIAVTGWAWASYFTLNTEIWPSTNPSENTSPGVVVRCAQYAGLMAFPAVFLLAWIVFSVTKA